MGTPHSWSQRPSSLQLPQREHTINAFSERVELGRGVRGGPRGRGDGAHWRERAGCHTGNNRGGGG